MGTIPTSHETQTMTTLIQTTAATHPHFIARLANPFKTYEAIRETACFFVIQDAEGYEQMVRKKTMKLAGRDARRGGSFKVMEFEAE